MNPKVSSGLIDRAPSPTQSDTPKGRIVLVAGPAGRGPTKPQVIESQADAYDIYGNEGPLANDIAMALRGARIGANNEGTSQIGQILAIRTETGESADVTLKDTGTKVMTLETATSGRRSNEWSITPKDGAIELYDPESGETATFTYDPTGTASGIQTPSELADAIQSATNERVITEVHRGEAHFELAISQQSSTGDIVVNTDDAATSIDFSDASLSDVQGLSAGDTAIGGEGEYFDATGEDSIYNFIIPQGAVNRVYAITAGGAEQLGAGQQEGSLNKLADSKRVAAGTNSLLNLHTTGDGSHTPLTDVGSRDGINTSEGYFQVRSDFVGRLDTNRTVDATAEFADHTAEIAADEDPSPYIGVTNAASPLTIDGIDLAVDQQVLIFGQGTDTDGLYTVAEDGTTGDLYLKSGRHRTASTLSSQGATIDIASGTNSGLQRYDAAEGTLLSPELIKFSFEAPFGIADEDGGSAGSLAESWANYLEGDTTNADKLSVGRVTPEGEDRFEADGNPLKLELAPITNSDNAQEFEGDMTVSWSDTTATILIDKAELERAYDDAIVYVSYDTCVFDIPERGSQSDLTGSGLEYTVDGQTLVFNQSLPHDLIVRPLRVTQYRVGRDLEIQRTGADGNRFEFTGHDNQPGPGGNALGDIETIFGFDYDYEPPFPPATTTKTFSGATSGVNASPQERAAALDQALREYGRFEHDMLVASGLYVDELDSEADPVTGAEISEPVGVLSIIEQHQDRMDANGASPVAFTSVRPMQPSTTTGLYTDEQKLERFSKLVDPPGPGETNTASIVQSESHRETFIYDAPFEISLDGGTVQTSSAAFWAGLRSTLANSTTLYEVKLGDILTPVYKYDVAGEDMAGQLAENRINTWDPKRNVTRLADDRTAAGYLVARDGSLQPNGWQSGIALVSAKEFQQESVGILDNLLGSVPQGGVDVLRSTVQTQLNGVGERTDGIQKVILDPQKDIDINAQGGNSMGMQINCTLIVNGELRSIDLRVGAVTESNAPESNDSSIAVSQ